MVILVLFVLKANQLLDHLLQMFHLNPPAFLERIQGDICGPIHPPSGPFHYFMVLIDASTRWSHVCHLSSRNVVFARLLAQIIRLRVQFPDHPIKIICIDNAGEFSSQTFLYLLYVLLV